MLSWFVLFNLCYMGYALLCNPRESLHKCWLLYYSDTSVFAILVDSCQFNKHRCRWLRNQSQVFTFQNHKFWPLTFQQSTCFFKSELYPSPSCLGSTYVSEEFHMDNNGPSSPSPHFLQGWSGQRRLSFQFRNGSMGGPENERALCGGRGRKWTYLQTFRSWW